MFNTGDEVEEVSTGQRGIIKSVVRYIGPYKPDILLHKKDESLSPPYYMVQMGSCIFTGTYTEEEIKHV